LSASNTCSEPWMAECNDESEPIINQVVNFGHNWPKSEA